jgi:diaminopropionate ammonia-lyase
MAQGGAVDNFWAAGPAARDWRSPRPTDAARAFHARLPGYRPTPLVELPALAAELGVGRVLVKDESARLGLPAFKILGASWAVARVASRRAGLAAVPADLGAISGQPLTLVTATEGNHGRAVARMAALLRLRAHVVVPRTLAAPTERAIRAEGATVERVEGDYDDAVRRAAALAADRSDAELVQDAAWPGYEEVPGWIVDGYATLAREIDEAGVRPDLVVVPVGVGSLAQAVIGHYKAAAGTAILSVEPESAACVLASLRAGEPVTVSTGDTVMAGLNCGTPSSAAWPYLRAGLDAATTVTDAAATRAVADLAALGVSSGPSGSAGLAGARAVLTGNGADTRREALGVGAGSVVVLLSTEGG